MLPSDSDSLTSLPATAPPSSVTVCADCAKLDTNTADGAESASATAVHHPRVTPGPLPCS